MKMFSKKGAVVFGAALAVCAFVVPSMASAAVWGPANTAHVLTSTNLAFSAHLPIGVAGSICADSRFNADTKSPVTDVLTITSATFSNCSGTGLAAGCTATATSSNLDWTATAPSTTNVQINRVDVSVLFETRPGGPLGSCLFENQTVRVTGTLNSGVWSAAAHSVTYTNAAGLFAHTPTLGGGNVATVSGVIADTSAVLLTLS